MSPREMTRLVFHNKLFFIVTQLTERCQEYKWLPCLLTVLKALDLNDLLQYGVNITQCSLKYTTIETTSLKDPSIITIKRKEANTHSLKVFAASVDYV